MEPEVSKSRAGQINLSADRPDKSLLPTLREEGVGGKVELWWQLSPRSGKGEGVAGAVGLTQVSR